MVFMDKRFMMSCSFYGHKVYDVLQLLWTGGL